MDLRANPIRDKRYIEEYLRTCPCLWTGERGAVEAVHIGTAGKSLKISDSMAIPLHYKFHRQGHQHSEIAMIRQFIPDDVLRDAVRLYGHHKLYLPWVEEGRPAVYKPSWER